MNAKTKEEKKAELERLKKTRTLDHIEWDDRVMLFGGVSVGAMGIFEDDDPEEYLEWLDHCIEVWKTYGKWSDELQNKTFEILNDPDSVLGWSMLPNESGVFKHTDGRYGFMKFGNAVSQNWIITLENGETETFESINDLLKAGWVLD